MVDWLQTLEALTQLEILLAKDDMQANTLIQDSAPLLRMALDSQADELKQCIDNFDYPTALSLLRVVRATRTELARQG